MSVVSKSHPCHLYGVRCMYHMLKQLNVNKACKTLICLANQIHFSESVLLTPIPIRWGTEIWHFQHTLPSAVNEWQILYSTDLWCMFQGLYRVVVHLKRRQDTFYDVEIKPMNAEVNACLCWLTLNRKVFRREYFRYALCTSTASMLTKRNETNIFEVSSEVITDNQSDVLCFDKCHNKQPSRKFIYRLLSNANITLRVYRQTILNTNKQPSTLQLFKNTI